MELIFRGKHLELTDGFRDYAEKRLERLARYLPVAEHAIVDVRREGTGEGRFVVQVTVNANGTFLRAEERAHQLEGAVDAVSDMLSRQVKRFKERKLDRSQRREGKEARVVAPEAEEETPEGPPGVEIVSGKVVKRKSFAVKPMTEAEAVEQMELLGHNFFLFRDEDRQGLALLYRRRDGDYGLILPESS